jgi:hypothetical protein
MGSHTPWADKGSVGSIARDFGRTGLELWRMWTTMRLAADESTLGALEVQSLSVSAEWPFYSLYIFSTYGIAGTGRFCV